jgi:RNA polymerase sigma factor (sigma-70 family)
VPDGPAAQDIAAEVTVRVVVRNALAVLPDRQRAVLVLRLFDDMSVAQVAQVLNCSAGTVKSTMSQALAKLRDDPRLVDLMGLGVR